MNRLKKRNIEPSLADRTSWAQSAVASFAQANDLAEDLRTDPQTVLTDLLTDLMHWCDAQKRGGRIKRAIDFESALSQACRHFKEETAE